MNDDIKKVEKWLEQAKDSPMPNEGMNNLSGRIDPFAREIRRNFGVVKRVNKGSHEEDR